MGTRTINAYSPLPSGLKIDASPSFTSNQSRPKASRMFGLWVTMSVFVAGSGPGGAMGGRGRGGRGVFVVGAERAPLGASGVAAGCLSPAHLARPLGRVV